MQTVIYHSIDAHDCLIVFLLKPVRLRLEMYKEYDFLMCLGLKANYL